MCLCVDKACQKKNLNPCICTEKQTKTSTSNFNETLKTAWQTHTTLSLLVYNCTEKKKLLKNTIIKSFIIINVSLMLRRHTTEQMSTFKTKSWSFQEHRLHVQSWTYFHPPPTKAVMFLIRILISIVQTWCN